ncbi:hypothetical protein DB347_15060 [Opitutaceae bacterium EW11]|nr:hypothetical protein DB347_15060 [Opitutaceae bacterium EW11]
MDHADNLAAHHSEAVQRTADYFSRQPDVQGLILGGSLAHGFNAPDSDVDVMIVVSDAEYARRLARAETCFFSRELCSYPDGYVDGKYIAMSLIRNVAERGSEPARFAFQDAKILFSRDTRLAEMIAAAARYPTAGMPERIRRFNAQVDAWSWYTEQALKRSNPYLLNLASAKLVLFCGRLILTHNQLLYPYHKWFLRVLERAPERPDDFLRDIDAFTRAPNTDRLHSLVKKVRDFRPWEAPPQGWPAQFMEDSELNWMSGAIPVDDL